MSQSALILGASGRFGRNAVRAFSACEGPFNREGVGFSGIDGTPRTVSEVKGAVAFVSPATNIPAELAELPTVQASSDETELQKVASAATGGH